jgi:predicted N-acetyltransferase YhbS
MTFTLEPLGPDHELGSFDSGNEELDRWLVEHARNATGQGTRTYVVTDAGRVAGYFAIAPHTIDREVLPKSQGRGAPRQIPAVLLAKLALDRSVQGQGLGSELLVVALETIVEAARRAGGKVVVVDAIDDDAAAFYERHDFVSTPSGPHRLVRKLSTIAKALELPWP